MPSDRDHFNKYRAQTHVKHKILTGYLPAYLRVLGSRHPTLGFVDAFAGRGTYDGDDGKVAGSPVQVLRLLAEDDNLRPRVRTALIEADPELFAQLQHETAKIAEQHPDLTRPLELPGEFAESIDAALKHVGNVPTFLFADPCGVEGIFFSAIKKVMDRESCEAFVFFNLEGVRRIAGLDRPSPVLVEFLGSEEHAARLHAAFQETMNARQRERLLIETYQGVLRQDMGVEFFLPFRVEAETRRTTSHYLIHLSKHRYGFRIMKDVMWSHGRTDEGGGLVFQQRSDEPDVNLIFKPQTEAIEQAVLEGIGDKVLSVETICKRWAECPDDYVSSNAYRQALRDLEAAGKIVVLDEDRRTPKPSTARPRRNGVRSLADRLYVRIN